MKETYKKHESFSNPFALLLKASRNVIIITNSFFFCSIKVIQPSYVTFTGITPGNVGLIRELMDIVKKKVKQYHCYGVLHIRKPLKNQ